MKRLNLDLSQKYSAIDGGEFEEPGTAIDIRSVFRAIWVNRWTIVLVTFCATVLGFLATMNIEPTYRASAKVMFDSQLREIAASDRMAPAITAEEDIQNEVQVLRSTSLLNRVIDDLELAEMPEFNPELGEPDFSLLKAALSFLGNRDESAEKLRAEIPDLQRRIVAMNVAQGLQLTPIPSSRVIEISFVSSDRSTSALVANAFATRYIHDKVEARLSTTRAATDWLAGRVDELRVRVQEAEQSVASARSSQSDQAGQSLEITRQQLEALIDTSSDIESAARAARADYERLRKALADGADLGTVPEFRDSELLTNFAMQEMNLRAQFASLSGKLPSDHYSILEIEDSLRNLDVIQQEEAARIVQASRARWESLQDQTRRIQSEIRALDRKVLQQAQDELNIRQLEREADASRRVYETFLERLNAASEQVKLESADARILSFAEPPLDTYSQPKKYAFAVTFIAGILASFLLIYLRDRLRNTFRSPDEVKRITGTGVLGMTPMLDGLERPDRIFRDFAEHPKSHLAEAVHGLRTGVLLNSRSKPPQVVLFTSSNPGEGKSILAALTALSAFRIDPKTVIVDCDLRQPQVHKIVGEGSERQNIISVIDGTTPLDEAIRQEPATGLHVLAGNLDHSQSGASAVDLLSSDGFATLIATLRDRYDLVILDAPPALLAVDAKILGEHADAIVYVVKWHATSRDAVLTGLRGFPDIGAPVSGVVLSMVKPMTPGRGRAGQYPFVDYDGVHG